ncbi:hypothetical protein HYW76_00120 [Candidatus Pacearchaeota archaeon]|nr:hypothetical protein [Candidatus Pacearchaeota archaeon]
MAIPAREFSEYCERDKQDTQRELHKQADREVNGDPDYWAAFSEEIDEHPIGVPRTMR